MPLSLLTTFPWLRCTNFLDEMLEAGHGGNRRPAAGFSAQVAQVAQVAQMAPVAQVYESIDVASALDQASPGPVELCTAVSLDLSQQDWNSMDI